MGTIDKLVLTASGGPFRGAAGGSREVTLDQALDHPTWAMGGKITIDSATLINKGLEVIEAHHLFGIPYERIEVLVHPSRSSTRWSSSTTALRSRTLALQDMRVPIS